MDKEVINARSRDMSTGEHFASKFGHFDIVNWIYPLFESHSAGKTKSGQTSLHFACIEGHIDIAKYLLMEMSAADVKARDTVGKRALHYAIQHNNVALVECFSALGKSFFQDEENEESYLQYACKYGHMDIAKYLLQQQHVKVDHAKDNGWTALHAACRNNQLNIVEILLSTGEADVNKATFEGWTALHLACRFGNLAVVKYLLHNGHAKVDSPANGKMTALHFATANGHIDIVQLLLNDGGAAIEAKTTEGLTPLHIACSRGFLGMIKLLLEHGAHVLVLNVKNETPMKYANRILNPPPPYDSRYGRVVYPDDYHSNMTIINDIASLLIPKQSLRIDIQLDSTATYDFSDLIA